MNYFYDVLILGGGGSGLSLAIKLKQAGVKNVAVLSKTNIMGSHTTAAKGGINASLGTMGEDSYKWHAFDTLTSANHLAEEQRVDFMCKQAPSEIEFLEKQGVKFDKLPNGKISQRKYGGQKTHYGKGDFAYRSCFSTDETGLEIMKNLHQKACEIDVIMHEFVFAFNASKTCVIALDLKSGSIAKFGFNVLVLAGGGFSQNYHTNSSSNALTGDAHAIALLLGAELEDMEFVQFHPTGLYGSGILISEAVRAEGGYLLNQKGERFMHKYSPNFLELAPRDVVARAIFAEGEGKYPAFLSLKHLNRELVATKLKGTVQTAKFFGGVDVFKEDIPVFPTAHYNMGGIKVDENYKLPGFANIFAIGECAGARIHGANRLGCNSLLELFTSSTLALEAILKLPLQGQKRSIDESVDLTFLQHKARLSLMQMLEMKQSLAIIMQEKCGVIREETQMWQALKEVQQMGDKLSQCSPAVDLLVFSSEFVLYFELKNLITLSLHVLQGAIERRESRGSHFRADFRELDPKYNRT